MNDDYSLKGSIPRLAQAAANILGTSRALVVTLLALGLWATIFIYRTVSWSDGVPYFSLFDDAMISMRYALNLVEGHGLVWNVGEAVEGYTNPLWTLYMAGIIALFGKMVAPLAVQLTGLALTMTTVAMAACAAREAWPTERRNVVAPRTLAFGVALMLVATLYPLHYWSLLGMEVSLLAALAAGAALVLARVETGRLTASRGLVLMLVAIPVAYFTRPDGFLVLTPLLALCFVRALQQGPRQSTVIGLAGLASSAVLVAAHLLWRFNYYGVFLPNTYTLKMDGYTLSLRLSNGLFFMSDFFAWYGVIILSALLMFLLFTRRSPMMAAFLASFVISVAYQVYVGGDAQSYWRQLVPGLVLLYVGLAISMGAGLKYFPNSRRPLPFLVALCGVLIFCIVTNVSYAQQIIGLNQPYQVPANNANVATAIALREVLQPDAKVLSFWAGAIPYYWGGKAIDPLGKTDSYVSKLPVDLTLAWNGMKGVPGHAKFDFYHSIVEAKPDYVQMGYWLRANLGFSEQFLAERYVSVRYKGLFLCLRKDSPFVRWGVVAMAGWCCQPGSRLCAQHFQSSLSQMDRFRAIGAQREIDVVRMTDGQQGDTRRKRDHHA